MNPKNVLLVPLNWGLGHVTRLIPVISGLQKNGACIFVAGSPEHQSLLKQEFSGLQYIKMPYLKVKYGSTPWHLLLGIFQFPFFFFHIFREHNALKKIIRTYKIDIVISDNCYGLWCKSVYSVIITHQLSIKLPVILKFFEPLVNKTIHKFLNKFDMCWIPDIVGNGGLAGELSHCINNRLNVRYIGLLSRFTGCNSQGLEIEKKSSKKQFLVIISGPEKQRTKFEEIIKAGLKYLPDNYTYTVVRGLPRSTNRSLSVNWFNHLSAKELCQNILCADLIIARSGYSSIMDFIVLGKTALLIPTPYQAEQVYLAEYLSEKGLFCTLPQQAFSLERGINVLETFMENREKPKIQLNSSLKDVLSEICAHSV